MTAARENLFAARRTTASFMEGGNDCKVQLGSSPVYERPPKPEVEKLRLPYKYLKALLLLS